MLMCSVEACCFHMGLFSISQICCTSLDYEERLLKWLLDEAFVLGVFFVSCQLQLCRCALSLTT